MRNLFRMSVLSFTLCATFANAAEFLVRFEKPGQEKTFLAGHGGKLEVVSKPGMLFKWTTASENDALEVSQWDSSVRYIQPNHTIHLPVSPSVEANRTAILKAIETAKKPPPKDDPWQDFLDFMEFMQDVSTLSSSGSAGPDNPAFKPVPTHRFGRDPLLGKAWGVQMIGATKRWSGSNSGKGIIVAVTDSGVDYNHEDLIASMWRNPLETENNNDDDGNGYVDDIVGWDFVSNDNKPYDFTTDTKTMLMGAGNPGHGTHVAGVIAAGLNNAVGVAGVAPNAQIMALRFINERGQGTTENAIKAIDYAVANGAKIINASWGGEKDDEDNSALVEAIERAEKTGVIFCAASGNGRMSLTGEGGGYDNDSDPKPALPATFDIANIVSVAAIDSKQKLASFSNWGQKSVKLAAPGVEIMSTIPGNRYQAVVIKLGKSIKATWDGTSMATPHVAGALAAIWSDHPTWDYKQVVDTMLKNVVPVRSLEDKVASGGRLNLDGI